MAAISEEWFVWLAGQPPYRRTLTQEECHILARDASLLATEIARLKSELDRLREDRDRLFAEATEQLVSMARLRDENDALRAASRGLNLD